MISLPSSWQELSWYRLQLEFMNTRMVPGARASVLSIFEAIIKAISARAFGNTTAPNRPIVFFHLPGKRFTYKPRPGSRIPVHVILCRAERDQVHKWAEAGEHYFRNPDTERNYQLIEQHPPETRNLMQLVAEMPSLKTEGEMALEFLTPLPFHPGKKSNRTFLTEQQFLKLFRERFARLFPHTHFELPAEPSFRILPYYWKFTQTRHRSHSQPGTVQLIKGCVGILYLKGNFQQILPWLILGSELHAGSKIANSQGYFRILPEAPAYFARFFPNRQTLLAVVQEVHEQNDEPLESPEGAEKHIYREEEYAEQLYRELAEDRYLPAPNIAFLIPKKDKTQHLVEQLPTRDYIVHRYLQKTLQKTFDRMFEEGSIGYRKGVSRATAVEMVRQAIKDGFQYVIESDIEDFFPSVDLNLLMKWLDFYLPTKDVLMRNLLKKCLFNGYVFQGKYYERTAGLAQGSPLSPLMANLFLDAFDEQISSWGARIIRYADDFIILTRNKEDAEKILRQTENYLATELGLRIHRGKTAIHPISEGFHFLGIHFAQWEAQIEPEEVLKRLRKPLYVTERNAFLGLNGEALSIYKNRKLIRMIPLRRLSEIIVMERVSFSTALLRACTEKNIPVTITLNSGYYITTIKPDSRKYYQTVLAHAQKYYSLSETERLSIAREIAATKLNNYFPLFRQRYTPAVREVLREIERFVGQIYQAGDIHQIRGYEGSGSRLIYRELNRFINPPEFALRKRRRKPPDRINSLLNFGYYLLFSRLNATVRSLGLNPYLGFLHSPEDNYESLVSDLVEIFRAHIDRFILRVVNLKIITAKDFLDTPRGMYLNREAARRFLLQFERELNRVPGNETLSLKDRIYFQVYIFRKWALEDASLTFFQWGKK